MKSWLFRSLMSGWLCTKGNCWKNVLQWSRSRQCRSRERSQSPERCLRWSREWWSGECRTPCSLSSRQPTAAVLGTPFSRHNKHVKKKGSILWNKKIQRQNQLERKVEEQFSHLKATNNEQTLDTVFPELFGKLGQVLLRQSTLGAEECAALADPGAYVRPIHVLHLTAKKESTTWKREKHTNDFSLLTVWRTLSFTSLEFQR